MAPRDDDHETVVVTAEEWAAVRQANTDQRRDLLDACAIADHNRLVAVLSERRYFARLLNVAASHTTGRTATLQFGVFTVRSTTARRCTGTSSARTGR